MLVQNAGWSIAPAQIMCGVISSSIVRPLRLGRGILLILQQLCWLMSDRYVMDLEGGDEGGSFNILYIASGTNKNHNISSLSDIKVT